MRDSSFSIFPEASASAPPFAARYVVQDISAAAWLVHDARDVPVARALTRAGARAAMRALHAHPQLPL